MIATILAGVVAAEHVWFLVMEMFLWRHRIGRRVFGTTAEFAEQSAAMAMNQGLYNGFLAAGIVFGLVTGNLRMVEFMLGCVVVAGIFGGATVKWTIAPIQGLPAAIALALYLL
jgi:putative membrane protein